MKRVALAVFGVVGLLTGCVGVSGNMVFGGVEVGSTAETVLTVTPEDGDVSLLELSVSGEGFELVGTTCESTLAADETCTVTVSFSPDHEGEFSGGLDIHSVDAKDNAYYGKALTGTGVLPE